MQWGPWLKFQSGSKWFCSTECYSEEVLAYRKRKCIRDEPKASYNCKGLLEPDTNRIRERWIGKDPVNTINFFSSFFFERKLQSRIIFVKK